jgi:hypothetical protein
MGSKKKTVASTRPQKKDAKTETKQKKEKKIFGKLFTKKQPKKKTEARVEKSPLKEEIQKVREEIVAEPKKEAAEDAYEKKFAAVAAKKKTGKKLSPAHRQKIRGGLLILIGLFALSFIGWFLFGKMFRPQYLAEILPADSTVAILEANIDGQSGQVKQFFDLMKNYAVYQHDGLVKLLTFVLPVDFAKEIEPWLGRRAGMALVSTAKKGELARIYFVESRDHNLTLEFMKSRAMQEAKEDLSITEYNGNKLYGYTLGHLFEFTFVGNYLVLAENQDTLKNLLDNISKGPALENNAAYRKVANNLPQGSLISGYLSTDKLFQVLSSDDSFLAKKGQDFMAFQPYLSIFNAAGFSCFADQGKFVIQTFVALNNDKLQDGKFITFSDKYRGSLLSIAPEEPVMLAAGHDLTKEINRLREIFTGGTDASAKVFDGLIEAQKEIYLGKGISLTEDVYPLLGGEYLLAVENSFEKPNISLILELTDKTRDIQRLEKIMSAFEKTGGFFTPKIQDVVLPDGTHGQEIVASPERIERYEDTYEEIAINDLKIGESGWNLYYATIDNKAIISTNKDVIKNTIDRINGNLTGSFATTNFYSRIVSQLMRSADELVVMKLGALTEILGLNDNEMLKPYLLPFSNLAAGKNYFTDGISTIYNLEII